MTDEARHIQTIKERIVSLSKEKSEWVRELVVLESGRGQQSMKAVTNSIPSTVTDKVLLFRRRFVARADVFPRFWENKNAGTKGYYPVCESIYEKGSRLKPTELFARYGAAKFARLDDRAIEDHLRGKHVVGSYAIRKDDTCIFLAADFDGDGWKECVAAYVDVAESFGFQVLVEISRSGNGAHAWLFFAEPTAASLARKLGSLILTKASSQLSKLDLSAYDRFFPNQDTMPRGGFGNLIGLPLQKERREKGYTIFVDADFSPFPNPWEALATTPAYWSNQVLDILEKTLEICPIENTDPFEVEEVSVSLAARTKPFSQAKIIDTEAVLNESLLISTKDLTDEFIAKLIKLATFPNPVFFEKQRMRFPVFNIPRYIVSADSRKGCLALPRGCLEEAIGLFQKRGARLLVNDLRLSGKHIRIRFTGSLSKEQNRAVRSFYEQDAGVLVAPPGSGKTVMACHLIGKWKLSTVVLVNRQTLARQWRVRLPEFTTISTDSLGSLGAGKKNLKGKIDIVMMQSLSKMDDLISFFSNYSAIIIDECHHVPAVSFESIMKHCGCKRILGLTATPKRKDGLEKLLFQQCGPVRYTSTEDADPNLEKNCHLTKTPFRLEHKECRYMPMHEIFEKLTTSKLRNGLIADQIKEQILAGRKIVVLSDRLIHLEILQKETIRILGKNPCAFATFVGGLGIRKTEKLRIRLEDSLKKGHPICIFATGSFLGEGFDMKELDTLFLTMPLSFKGRLIQYAGRLHRKCNGKSDVRVFDFMDTKLPVAMSMYRKRRSAYREMGYHVIDAFL